MSFFRKKEPDGEVPLRERGEAAMRSIRETVSRGAAHASTLFSLFKLEAGECIGRLVRKLLLLIAGGFLLLCGYCLLVAWVCSLLATFVGWVGALGIVCAFHMLLGGVLVVRGIKRKVGPVAPATVEEIKKDVQCIKILVKEKSKNF